MGDFGNAMVRLNDYPPDKYNVLVPVTSMQAMSGLQKVIVNEVRLDPDPVSGNDVYKDKQSGKLAVTAVGGAKLAAAANISIIASVEEQPGVCRKCVEMAKATGKAPRCGGCEHAYDVKHSVTVRVPEPSGGFRAITKSKEIDCAVEKEGMTASQYKRFLPHRASMAETKAFMRCLRAALGLAQLYTPQEIARPFVIARIVPNLDAPEIRQALAERSLRDMGMLFEAPAAAQGGIPQKEPPAIGDAGGDGAESGDGDEGMDWEGLIPSDAGAEGAAAEAAAEPPWEEAPEAAAITCEGCGREIRESAGANGQRWTPEAIKGFSVKRYGRCLCPECQKGAQRRWAT